MHDFWISTVGTSDNNLSANLLDEN